MFRSSLPRRCLPSPAVLLLRAVPRPAWLALAAVTAAGLAVGLPAAAQAAVPSTTFTYTGQEQTYTVPAGVTEVTVTAVGAPGGSGQGVGDGGDGASVTATVPLPANTTTLYIEVGGAGPTNNLSTVPVPGGFNGGGSSGYGGTGGGASDVRTVSCGSPCDTTSSDSLASRLVVAGGGGGGGSYNGFYCSTGPGGGSAGDKSVTGPGNGGDGNGGDTCNTTDNYGGDGGFGGTAGGTGGAATPELACSGGGNGSLGQGGIAYFPPVCAGDWGGGGGGGYYGGGGGGDVGTLNGGSGGAGSSWWVTGATNTSMSEDTTGQPAEVIITPVISPLKVTTTSLSAATGGKPYSATLAATGGLLPYSWSVTSGSLPPGLKLNAATGAISGTPDVAGTYSFTVTVTDSETPPVTATSQTLSITVSGPVITAIRPDRGPFFGFTPVLITGTGLSCPPGQRGCRVTVTFGQRRALVVLDRPTKIWVMSPAGSGTQTVTVTVGGVSSQPATFTYLRFL
jgi:hypothetical protein